MLLLLLLLLLVVLFVVVFIVLLLAVIVIIAALFGTCDEARGAQGSLHAPPLERGLQIVHKTAAAAAASVSAA